MHILRVNHRKDEYFKYASHEKRWPNNPHDALRQHAGRLRICRQCICRLCTRVCTRVRTHALQGFSKDLRTGTVPVCAWFRA